MNVFVMSDPETKQVIGVLDTPETAIAAVLAAAGVRTNTSPADWHVTNVTKQGRVTVRNGLLEVQAQVENWEVDTL